MYNTIYNNQLPIISVLNTKPSAKAKIKGSMEYSGISGVAQFYQTNLGVIVYVEVRNLPKSEKSCDDRIFAFHIHEGSSCTGDMTDPFSNAMLHYNPNDCKHPYHAGDLPPLFGNNGFAISIFLTDRFSVSEIIGKTIIIHNNFDDFTTQPSGNSGVKIACGVIYQNNYE